MGCKVRKLRVRGARAEFLECIYIYITVICTRAHVCPAPLPSPLADERCPEVLVQLPVYNERVVAERLLETVAALDWPRDRMHVQVLDDSTDETGFIVARTVQRL